MRSCYFIVCFGWIALSACNQHLAKMGTKSVLTDTLNYTYQTIKKRADYCGNKPDSGCTTADIKYPLFVNQKLLNDSIKNKLLQIFSFGDQEKKDTSLDQLAQSVITSYQADTQAVRNKVPYTLDLSAKVLRQDSSLVVIELGGYAFSGGAHGGTQTLFVNWNTSSDKQISLDDLFVNDYKAQLNAIAEKIFRKDEKLGDNASLANYFFDKGKFSLNTNFKIMPTGLNFLYNEYEIKSYAEGQTTLFIPYAQLKSLLRPNTVVSPFIK
jgi:hypothetical protein